APDNPLIFMNGPLTDTIMTSGRFQIISRSPLTGTICSSSSGGVFGAALKKAGFDGVIITGRAAEPVYLFIENGNFELKSADRLWGENCPATRKKLQQEHGNVSVASIGPAGENLVLYAAVMNDRDRAAGRGGLGAVMGAKNLKALAVKGKGEVELHDREGLNAIQPLLDRLVDKNPITGKALQLLGTAVLVDIINDHGMLATRNFRRGQFNDVDGINGDKIHELILRGKSACYKCPIACGRSTATARHQGEGPEFETIWAFGPQLGINDLPAITEANYLCNELGLDTISTGNTIGCGMELVEEGIFTAPLKWGNAANLAQVVENIAYRRNYGDDLALGSKRLAEKYQRPQIAMQVKGMELPAYDPRGAQGQALAYATSNRGGCHIYAYMIGPEILGQPVKVDRFKTSGKAELTVLMQDISALVDSLILCRFLQFSFGIGTFRKLLNLVTGSRLDDDDLLKIGKRIYTLERIYNIRAGFTSRDDMLPERFLTETLPEGPSRNRTVDLKTMLQRYYQVRGWDSEGIPLASTLTELGIKESCWK
ncbi:MAG: aldehyde ferredoxin oxidoreductase family protein, partial [Candidatus Cloacimonetes bacterium]|nr:aldehyde ferredoxin oxidoreductase family protein [Candidatus Cloacimonadota bacterium]